MSLRLGQHRKSRAEDLPRAAAGEADRVVLRPSKLKWSALTAVAALLAGGGVLMATDGEAWGWAIAAFFGLGAVIGVLNLVPGASHLAVDREGFEMRSLFRSARVRWEDAEAFTPASTGYSRMVGVNLSPSHERGQLARRFARGLSGAEGALPDTYGLGVERLVELMNESRARALATHGRGLGGVHPPP